MKFGIFDHLDVRDEPLSKTYDERLKLLHIADAADFHAYHLAEHHGTPLGAAPSPSVFLAAVARETKRIRFGPLVYLLPLYHPLRLIEEICILDNLSGGRFELGVGRGISPIEIGFFGVSPDASHALFREALMVILKGLSSERLIHHGEHFSFDGVPMALRPVQKPHPPLWAGVGGRESQEFAAMVGMNMMVNGPTPRVKSLVETVRGELWPNREIDPVLPETPVREPFLGGARQIVVADTDDDADKLAHAAYDNWYGKLVKLWRDYNVTYNASIFLTYEQAKDAGLILVGAPDTVQAKISAEAAETGANYCVLQFAFGDLGHAREADSMRLFVDHVMPAFA
jgi:alkanesulfonate monooxygenase SsuD/methylene tetrahydromethanopterin reductase-like flavin-dependent oxidoreductase (luciferase family)